MRISDWSSDVCSSDLILEEAAELRLIDDFELAVLVQRLLADVLDADVGDDVIRRFLVNDVFLRERGMHLIAGEVAVHADDQQRILARFGRPRRKILRLRANTRPPPAVLARTRPPPRAANGRA